MLIDYLARTYDILDCSEITLETFGFKEHCSNHLIKMQKLFTYHNQSFTYFNYGCSLQTFLLLKSLLDNYFTQNDVFAEDVRTMINLLFFSQATFIL